MKLVVVVALAAVALGCAWGLVATFEPMDSGEQLTWRIVYGTGALLGLAGAAWVLRTPEE